MTSLHGGHKRLDLGLRSWTKQLVLVACILQAPSVKSDADPLAFQVAPIYPSPEERTQLFTTKTVQGFLDYVTTVGNTVIFFTQEGGSSLSSPSSKSAVTSTAASTSPPKDWSEEPIIKVESNQPITNLSGIQPTAVVQQTTTTTSPTAQHQEDDTNSQDNISQPQAVAVSAKAVHGKEEETVATRPVDAVEEDLARAREATNTLKNRSRVSERTSAISSFKERLKKRFEEAKQEDGPNTQPDKSKRKPKTSARGSSSSEDSSLFLLDGEPEVGRSRRFKAPPSSFSSGKIVNRSGNGRSLNIGAEEDVDWAEDDALSSFNDDLTTEETTSGSRDGFGRSVSGFGSSGATRRRQASSPPSSRQSSSSNSNARSSFFATQQGAGVAERIAGQPAL